MYIEHFGLAQYPFSLTPNTRYFLKLPSHEQAFDLLMEALDGDSFFARITGEPGTGKTMLCRKVLNSLELHKKKYVTAYIPHPILTEEGILHAIAEELGIFYKAGSSYRDLLKALSEALIALRQEGQLAVLFIDEAQAMPEETLKAVHLLTQAGSANNKHLQVILFGQPELEVLLDRPSLRQLRRELSCSFQIPALDRAGVESYVNHRLGKAGYTGPGLFTKAALDKLHEGSKGIPRLINILCHKALMVAFGKGVASIELAFIESAIADTEVIDREQSLMERLFAG